jgi:ferric-dicitrate binding protein FerR (iron transport regulator)
MKPLPIQPELLEKYLKGTCTTEEKNTVEDWYSELDKSTASETIPVFDKFKSFDKIKQHIEDFDHAEEPAPRQIFSLPRGKMIFTAIAATLILAIGINYLKNTENTSATSLIANKAEIIVLNNNTAAIVERRLPDGSSIWLKPGSKLTYERKNEESEREVTFTGEAFFEVAKDASHPFIIHADKMKIRVVGTSFNVIALPGSRTFRVSVVTGKVEVIARDKSGNAESVYLTPKQQASFNLSSQKFVHTLLTETQLKQQYWKPFSLNFTDEATMGVVATELEKAFQIKVKFSDPGIANCQLKVDFNSQQLPEIINYLEKLLDVSCEMVDGSTLKITGEGCSL